MLGLWGRSHGVDCRCGPAESSQNGVTAPHAHRGWCTRQGGRQRPSCTGVPHCHPCAHPAIPARTQWPHTGQAESSGHLVQSAVSHHTGKGGLGDISATWGSKTEIDRRPNGRYTYPHTCPRYFSPVLLPLDFSKNLRQFAHSLGGRLRARGTTPVTPPSTRRVSGIYTPHRSRPCTYTNHHRYTTTSIVVAP